MPHLEGRNGRSQRSLARDRAGKGYEYEVRWRSTWLPQERIGQPCTTTANESPVVHSIVENAWGDWLSMAYRVKLRLLSSTLERPHLCSSISALQSLHSMPLPGLARGLLSLSTISRARQKSLVETKKLYHYGALLILAALYVGLESLHHKSMVFSSTP